MGKLVGWAPCKWLNRRNLVLNAMGMELLIKALTTKRPARRAMEAELSPMTDKNPKRCGTQTASPSRYCPVSRLARLAISDRPQPVPRRRGRTQQRAFYGRARAPVTDRSILSSSAKLSIALSTVVNSNAVLTE